MRRGLCRWGVSSWKTQLGSMATCIRRLREEETGELEEKVESWVEKEERSMSIGQQSELKLSAGNTGTATRSLSSWCLVGVLFPASGCAVFRKAESPLGSWQVRKEGFLAITEMNRDKAKRFCSYPWLIWGWRMFCVLLFLVRSLWRGRQGGTSGFVAALGPSQPWIFIQDSGNTR